MSVVGVALTLRSALRKRDFKYVFYRGISKLWPAGTAWLVILILACCGAAEAMQIDGAAIATPDYLLSASDSATKPSSELLHTTPKGDFSLKVSYLPENRKKGILAGSRGGTNLSSIGNNLSGGNRLRPPGKGSLLAEYKPSSSLAMHFSLENSFKPAAQGIHQGQMNSNLSYGLVFAPSASSQLTATWKHLRKEASSGSSKQSAEFGYALKFSGGLLRLSRKTLLSSTAGTSAKQATTSMHADWSKAGKMAFTADHSSKQLPSGSQRYSTLKGNLTFSPRTSAAFKLHRRQASGSPQQARAQLSLAADIGSPKAPLQLTGRMLRGADGSTHGVLEELGFNGGLGEGKFGLKFSGKMREQQGTLDSKPAGSFRNLRLETTYSRLRLTTENQSFDSTEGADLHKSKLRAGYALTPATEIFWLHQKETGENASGFREIGIKHSLTNMELGLGHQQRAASLGEGRWDSARLLWKTGGELPNWAKSLGDKPFFTNIEEGQKYGFSASPSWAKTAAPGVEVAWRKRSDSSGGRDSLRFVYRNMLGGLHLRTGHESNPWSGSSSSEQVTGGERDFLEVGLPLNEKFTGVARLSRSEGLTEGSRRIFFSLAGKLSETEKLECFFTNEIESEVESIAVQPGTPTYGLIYSNTRSDEHYLRVKASVNPPADLAENLNQWRVEIALSQPF